MEAIRVVGMGVMTSVGRGPGAVVDALCQRVRGFHPYPSFQTAGVRFPTAAALAEGALDDLDIPSDWGRGARMLYGTVRDALLDATGGDSLASIDVDPVRVGMVVGTSAGGIGALTEALSAASPVEPSAHNEPRYAHATELVAQSLGVRGEISTVCNVCASGALAVQEAAELLLSGDADVVIAAAFDPLEPFVGVGFDVIGAVAPEAFPFRANRRGLMLGEGAAALILCRESKRFQHHRGWLLGWGSSSDAHHLTAPHPDGLGLSLAAERALRCANIATEQVGAVNAHGTATVYNDQMETRAIQAVFGAGTKIPVYTVKGAIGHTLGASGAIEAVVSLAAMERGVVPPTITSDELDPACDLNIITDTELAKVDVTLSLSAGFGGANAALVLGSPHHEAEHRDE